MCTFNGAPFVWEQLESIAAQTRLPDELIVLDDRSTDRTMEIIHSFAANARFPVRAKVNEVNCGVTQNFQSAISLCQGEIIALCDQDDIWNPRKLVRIAEIFDHSSATAAVFSDGELIDSSSRALRKRLWGTFFFGRKDQWRFRRGQGLSVLLKRSVVTGATLAFRKRFCELVLPIPAAHVHDYWIAILLSCCGDIQPIPEALIQYRQHGKQQIGPGPARLSLVNRTKKGLQVDRQSYLAEVTCLKDICTRLDAQKSEFPFRESAMDLITKKIMHRSARATLPASKLRRLPTVFRQMVNRGYWNYSGGWKSVAKDVFV
jgi:glycosyltransferase involved in cell wall biosynthesis